jgi:hypothetical protein
MSPPTAKDDELLIGLAFIIDSGDVMPLFNPYIMIDWSGVRAVGTIVQTQFG